MTLPIGCEGQRLKYSHHNADPSTQCDNSATGPGVREAPVGSTISWVRMTVPKQVSVPFSSPLLSLLQLLASSIGLYRDDGLLVTADRNPKQLETLGPKSPTTETYLGSCATSFQG